MPAARQRSRSLVMAWAVMAMIGVCLPVWRSVSRMIRVASKPFISGISTSISTTSKLEVAVLPLALGGFDLQPDIGEVKVAVDEGDVVDRADGPAPVLLVVAAVATRLIAAIPVLASAVRTLEGFVIKSVITWREGGGFGSHGSSQRGGASACYASRSSRAPL